ncbi:uncharacterized protein L199_001691 [Kwoniella botswanensis]|uniref:uncharacterized protein n=1 Tax=Kwoniella botswanensis TaxID=1268659 RepID=UPI00315CDA8D
MPPRKKTSSSSKKAKSKIDDKKAAPPSTKKATPNNQTARAALRRQPSNEAISLNEHEGKEQDGVKPSDEILEDAVEAPADRLTPFPDEVLKRIFEYCLEEGKEGYYVAQKTLATLLRVNSVFLKIAGAVLYDSPIVINTESFFLGSHRSLETGRGYIFAPEQHGGNIRKYLESLTGGKDTKLPLLDHVRHLRIVSPIVPKIIDGEELPVTQEYIDKLLDDDDDDESDYGCEVYHNTVNILSTERTQNHLTPNLISISIGSPLRIDLDFDLDPDKNDIHSVIRLAQLENYFGVGIALMRTHLWKRCLPIEWIEYQNEITGYYRPEKLKRSPMRSPWIKDDEQYIPEIHTIYTTLLESFSIIWGSVNKIILRKPTEKEDKWKKLRLVNYVAMGALSPDSLSKAMSRDRSDAEDGSENDRRMMYMDYKTLNPQATKKIISNIIKDSHPVKYTKPKITAKLKRKLEDETGVEVYGYEEVHGLGQDEYDQIWNRRKEILRDWAKDKKVDMSYVQEQIEMVGYNLDNDEYNTSPPQQQSSEDDDGEEEEDDDNVDEPLSEEAQHRRLDRAKLRFWLAHADYDLIKSMHDEFKYKDRKWLNGNEGSGIKIRFRPMCDMLDLGDSYIQRGFDPEWDPIMVW